MFSTTLKRNSKLDLGRNDLIKLVTMLEGELQAREIVIAVLKSEQIKSVISANKPPNGSGIRKTHDLNSLVEESPNHDLKPNQTIKYTSDPVASLSRDSFALYEPSLDHKTALSIHNLKTYQLEAMLKTQLQVRNSINEQVKTVGERYEKLLIELEDEKRKNRELQDKYKQYDRQKLEDEIQSLRAQLEENSAREKQIVLTLVNERKHLVLKLLNEREDRNELLQTLNCEKRKVAEIEEMLEDESKRSLQMEADIEKCMADFAEERKGFLALIDEKSRMIEELSRDRTATVTASSTKPVEKEVLNLGEGVRSSIVTQPVTTKVHSQSSVTTVSHPKASVAQPAVKSIPSTILPPPSIPVPQPKLGMGTIKRAPMSASMVPKPSVLSTPPALPSTAPPVLSPAVVPSPSQATNTTTTTTTAASAPLTTQDVIHPQTPQGIKPPTEVQTTKEAPTVPVKPTVPTEAAPITTTTDSNHTASAVPTTNNNPKNQFKEKILLFEKSAEVSKTPAPALIVRKSSTGAIRVPPPVPPNKPTIKPVMPANVFNRTNSQTKIQAPSTITTTAATPTPTSQPLSTTPNCNSTAST